MVTTFSGEINSHEIFREFGAEIWLELFVFIHHYSCS